MKDRIAKAQARLALLLWALVVLLFIAVAVSLLESDDLIKTGQASGWYIASLNSISIANFS